MVGFFLLTFMARLKCKKCGNVFEHKYNPLDSMVHLGPYKYIRCPACGKNGWFNVYSSVKDAVTWPPEAREKERQAEPEPSAEELEKRRIEESKYERS